MNHMQMMKTIVVMAIVILVLTPGTMPGADNEPESPDVSEVKMPDNYSADIELPSPKARLIDGYHTFPEIEAELIAIAGAHPGICQLFSMGQSWEGRELWVMKVSDNPSANESEPELFINGGIHAREWIADEVPLYYLNWLVDNYGTDTQATWLVDNRQIFIAPCVNPDGLVYCQNVADWRKNRRDNGDGSYGVDLNRNWGGACNGDPDGDWGGTGVSHTPSAETYCGPNAFSEPETQAMRDLILAHDFQITITYHSYGEELYWPWGYSTTVQAPHDSVLTAMGTAIAQENGYTPMQSSLLYETTGDTDDWTYGYSWYNLGKVVCAHTIELGTSFQPDESLIVPICQANCLANIFAAEAAGNIYLDSPIITHTPLPDTYDTTGPYSVEASIATANGLQPGATKLFWRQTGNPWNEVAMTNTGGSTWEADIPGQANGTRVHYYIETADVNSHMSSSPGYSPYEFHDFFVGVDTTPPGPPQGLSVDWWSGGLNTIYYEDFEGDGTPSFGELGWTTGGASNDWQIGIPGGLGGDYGNPDPTGAYSGSFSIGNDITGIGTYPGDYEAGLTADSNWIISADVDCTGYTDVSLSFQRYLGVEQPTYDHAYIEVSADGTAFTQVWTNPATTSDSSWTEVNYDISAVADGEPTVYLRFEIGASDGSWQYCGWNIDDLRVSGYQPAGTEDNLLNWTLSADDGAGADDISNYNIYRTAASSGPWGPADIIGTVPAGTSTYTDNGRGEFDGINWWYVVRAEDIWGNEEQNANAVPEQVLATVEYGIDLTGKSASSWVFVSFPIAVSGSIQDILNDATLGDGLTTWTVAKWYNPQTPADPWKTYRVGGTYNDLATVSNLVGIWLWITANGGDQDLTVAVEGAYPAASVNINLYTGWNLVGYPSATARLGSETLPALADRVSVWQAASPYIADSVPGAVTMSHGHAYWVHVTADCTWMVNP